MPDIVLDFSSVKDLPLPPEGWTSKWGAHGQIVAAEQVVSSNGNPMIAVQWKLVVPEGGDEKMAQKIFDHLMLAPEDALWRIGGFLVEIGLAEKVETGEFDSKGKPMTRIAAKPFQPDDLIGVVLDLRLKNKTGDYAGRGMDISGYRKAVPTMQTALS